MPPIVRCSNCGSEFDSNLTKQFGGERQYVCFENCLIVCPVCGKGTILPDVVISSGKIVWRALKEIWESSHPLQAASQAIAAVESLKANPENVEAISDIPGLGWIKDFLPQDRKERRDDVKWAAAVALQISALVVAVLALIVNYLKSKPSVDFNNPVIQKEINEIVDKAIRDSDAKPAHQQSFLLYGIDKTCGFSTCEVVHANSEEEVRRYADEKGIEVKKILPGF